MKLIFVRHGETYANAIGMISGQTESSYSRLNETGIMQAKRAAEKLKDKKVEIIYCSDMVRTLQTANEIHKFHKDVPLVKDKMLRERKYGTFEGKVMRGTEKDEFYKARYGVGKMIGGGEQLEDAYDRVYNEISRILSLHKDGNVMIVAHSGVGRLLVAIIKGIRIDDIPKIVEQPKNAEPLEFEFNELEYLGAKTYKS
jgi:broad specificity phosphatase PhoE